MKQLPLDKYTQRAFHLYRSYTNSWENLPVLKTHPWVDCLYTMPRVPALVIGAGPSLNAQADLLRQAAGKCLMIAADAAVPYLNSIGVVPHLAISADPQQHVARYYPEGISPRTVVVYDPRVSPVVLESTKQHAHVAVCLGNHLMTMLGQFLHPFRRLKSWGTVVSGALAVAHAMGCEPIVLVGNELCYHGGQSHCAGHWNETAKRPAETTRHDKYTGDDVGTTNTFVRYQRYMGYQRKHHLIKREVLNATPYGLHIAGVPDVDFAQLLDGIDKHGRALHLEIANCVSAAKPVVWEPGHLRHVMNVLRRLALHPPGDKDYYKQIDNYAVVLKPYTDVIAIHGDGIDRVAEHRNYIIQKLEAVIEV